MIDEDNIFQQMSKNCTQVIFLILFLLEYSIEIGILKFIGLVQYFWNT